MIEVLEESPSLGANFILCVLKFECSCPVGCMGLGPAKISKQIKLV